MSALLSVPGLRKHFGGLRAVDGVDLEVAAGERRAVIGPNGAGKTTLFNLITGQMTPDAWSVTFDGDDITGRPTYRIARAGTGRAFQITSIFAGLTVHENAARSSSRGAAKPDGRSAPPTVCTPTRSATCSTRSGCVP